MSEDILDNDNLDNKELVSKPKKVEDKILPGSSEPQDLGAISYKDTSHSFKLALDVL